MRIKNLALISFFAVFLVLISTANAEVIISQPKPMYNLGEELSFIIEIDEFQEGYLDVSFVCFGENSTTNIKNFYHGIMAEKAIQITRRLIPLYIESLKGTCHIEARYGADAKISQNFEVSDKLKVNLDMNDLEHKAGEKAAVKGTAVKENNDAVNGYVEIKISNESKATGIIEAGKFNVSFLISEKEAGGTSTLLVTAYDKDDEGNILNKGEARIDLKIIQEPSWIEIAIDKQIIFPEEEIKIIPLLYDKANAEINGEEILLRIQDSKGKIIYEKIVKTGEEINYKLESNHEAGRSSIIAEKENSGIIGEKIFEVRKYPKISSELINDTLTIKNIGNVIYDKTIEITLGEKIILKKITLNKGESVAYKLEAPDGQYGISIRDEYGTIQEGNIALTGNAISVTEVKKQMGLLVRYPLVWLFIIILIGLVAWVMYKNNKKRKSYSFPVSEENLTKKREQNKEPKERAEGLIKEGQGEVLDRNKNIVKIGAITKAEHVLVLNGQKQNAAVMAIKIKNKIEKQGRQTLNKALEEAYKLKGVPCQIGDTLLVVFLPSVTKTLKNPENAIKSGLKIEEALKEHNHKFKDRVDFGIGINSGELIAKIEEEKLKFTSIGPTINIAKRIAHIAKQEMLLSKDAHQRTISDVKVDKAHEETKNNKIELFKVKRIVDTEKNRQFIQEFMGRIGKDKK